MELTDDNFESQLAASQLPVLVDFWAEWCEPCKRIAPVLDEVAKSMKDEVVIAKLNVDDHKATPSKLGIHGIPTMILFMDGKEVGRKVGAVGKTQLMEFIQQQLDQAAN